MGSNPTGARQNPGNLTSFLTKFRARGRNKNKKSSPSRHAHGRLGKNQLWHDRGLTQIFLRPPILTMVEYFKFLHPPLQPRAAKLVPICLR